MSEHTIEAYNKQASSYEAKWESYLSHTHEAFLRCITTSPDDTILDASGGTGLLANMLIEQDYIFNHLIINDPSEKMLAIASSRLSDKHELSFSNYKAEQLPFKANCFDQILCLNAFHFYTNQAEVLERFNTMLKPGGRLSILDWNRAGFFMVVNQLLKWSTSEHIDTRSLPEMNKLLSRSGFEIGSEDSWRWRYWKFFFVKTYKTK